MKRLLILAVICLFLSSMAMGQVCVKQKTTLEYGPIPSDGFVVGQPLATMAVTKYAPSTSFLTGFLGDYRADAANRGIWQLRCGYVIPISGAWYSITLGAIGQGEAGSEQYQAEQRLGYALTAPSENWNLFIITGGGVSYESLPSKPDEVMALFKGSAGLSASIPISGSWGLWLMTEYGWTEFHEGLVCGIGGSFFIGK